MRKLYMIKMLKFGGYVACARIVAEPLMKTLLEVLTVRLTEDKWLPLAKVEEILGTISVSTFKKAGEDFLTGVAAGVLTGLILPEKYLK